MYSPFHLAIKYFRYYLFASNGRGHGIHSPFVFDFITKVLNDKCHFPEYDRSEGLRKKLLSDKSELMVEDFGAGSSFGHSKRRSISQIAKNSAKPPKFGKLIFRIVRRYGCNNILELGTSLGMTTTYLAMANPHSKIITLEGAGEVAAIAKENFKKVELSNISLIEGNFDNTLEDAIIQMPEIDLAFVDGNHREEPTLRYFDRILSKVSNESIIILDDIHWSNEMESAWKKIKEREEVKCSIDLFFLGIVFFRKEFHEKQHFIIRF